MLEFIPGGVRSEITVAKARDLLEQLQLGDPVAHHRVLIANELIDEIARLDDRHDRVEATLAAAVAAVGTTPHLRSTGSARSSRRCSSATPATSPGSRPGATTPATTRPHPIEASSGPKARHRLNPRGNRQLNWAIHTAAITQLRYDTPGRRFYDRKVAEGKTTKEALRALKRRLSDVIYRHSPSTLAASSSDR